MAGQQGTRNRQGSRNRPVGTAPESDSVHLKKIQGIRSVSGSRCRAHDDAVILAAGYRPNLDFLPDSTSRLVGLLLQVDAVRAARPGS